MKIRQVLRGEWQEFESDGWYAEYVIALLWWYVCHDNPDRTWEYCLAKAMFYQALERREIERRRR